MFNIFFGGIGIFSAISAWFMLILLIMIVLVFIRRIFEVVVLYVVSPFFVSAIPLDDGKRFGGWRDQFISRLLAGFGSIFMLRIFIMMLPTIWSPDLTLSSNTTADTLMKLFFMAGGIFTIWKSHTLISQVINPQGAAAEQESSAGGLAAAGLAFGAGTTVAGGAWNLGTGAIGGIKARFSGGGDSGSSSSSSAPSSGNSNPNL
ncbi:MAG: hypothetical protein FWH17_02480 [Oscillospiraceae bacterium]|nr:hypothetical protein [Oscillospiraceae bacterium]